VPIFLLNRQFSRRATQKSIFALGLTLLISVLPMLAEIHSQSPSQPPPPQSQSPAPSQDQEKPKVTLQVKTVSVIASVRDKKGKIVNNLTQGDFAIDEDGRPQTINYFAKESDAPLRLGLLIDTSLSQRNVLDAERDASYKVLDNLLRVDKDLAFIIKFDREVELLRDFTADRNKLQAALHDVQSPSFGQGGGNRGGNRGGTGGGPVWSGSGGSSGGGGQRRGGGGHGGAGTLLYDAVYLASDELMSKQQGRKALIILSDGVDHGSKETVDEAIETAQRADTVVYSIFYTGEENGGHGGHGPYGSPRQRDSRERPDGKSILEEISLKTGGRLFEVSKKETIEKIYAEIDEELRNQYSLGYTPDKGAEPGYHKLHVTTKNKDLKVQARDGYYGGSDPLKN
jgi:VWFA-related protein